MSFLTSTYSKRILTFCVYALFLFFFIGYVSTLEFSVLQDIRFDWRYLLAALPFSALSRLFLPYVWVRLIGNYQTVESRHTYWQLNYVYAKAWLGKYIPGKVAWVAGKVYFALGLGYSKVVLGITSIVDAILQLLTALIFGVVFLFISGSSANFSGIFIGFFLLCSVVGMIAISPPIFNRLIQISYKLFKKKELDAKYLLSSSVLVRVAPLYFAVHALSGLPIYFIIRAMGIELDLIDIIYVSGSFVFAGAIGTLALFAPSGIGVREGVILLFLSGIMAPEIGVLVVVVLRMWAVGLDVLYWAVSWLLVKYLSR